MTVNLKKFIFDSCSILNIKIEKVDDYYRVSIPEQLQNHFTNSTFYISFKKTSHEKVSLIHPNSYFLQKLAEKITEREHIPITFVKGDENAILYFYSVSYKSYQTIEEIVIGVYNLDQQTVNIKKNLNTDQFRQNSPKVDTSVAFDKQNDIELKLIEHIRSEVKIKNITNQQTIKKEKDRIISYYKTLISEKRSRNIINELTQERDRLLLQQDEKYGYFFENTSFHCIGVLFQSKGEA